MANKKLIEEIKRKLNNAGSDQLTELANVMNKKSWTSKAPTKIVRNETDPMSTAVASQISKSLEDLNKTIKSSSQPTQQVSPQREEVRWIQGGGGGFGSSLGVTTDPAITSDTNGTAIGFLRGLVKMVGDVWNSTVHYLGVSLKEAIAGEDIQQDVLKTEFRYTPSGEITSNTAVLASSGFIHTVTFVCADSAPTAGSINIYNNASAASGTKLVSTSITTTWFAPVTVVLDKTCSAGIYVAFTTTADVSVFISYRADA